MVVSPPLLPKRRKSYSFFTVYEDRPENDNAQNEVLRQDNEQVKCHGHRLGAHCIPEKKVSLNVAFDKVDARR